MKKYRQVSPGRAKVWTEKSPKYFQNRKVPVVYYLSRNRQLEHPHFIEVPLSSPEGLYLRGNSEAGATFFFPFFPPPRPSSFPSLVFHLLRMRFVLADVIDRLNVLRGRGMASMYSWSSKR